MFDDWKKDGSHETAPASRARQQYEAVNFAKPTEGDAFLQPEKKNVMGGEKDGRAAEVFRGSIRGTSSSPSVVVPTRESIDWRGRKTVFLLAAAAVYEVRSFTKKAHSPRRER